MATPYTPPDSEDSKKGWKLERVPDATVPDYAGKPPSEKPGPKDPDGGRGSPFTSNVNMEGHDMGPVAPEEPPSTSPDILEAEPAPAPDMAPVAPEESTTGPAEPPSGAGVEAAGRAARFARGG